MSEIPSAPASTHALAINKGSQKFGVNFTINGKDVFFRTLETTDAAILGS